MAVADGYASNSTTSTQKLWNFVAGVPGVAGFASGVAAEFNKIPLSVGCATEGQGIRANCLSLKRVAADQQNSLVSGPRNWANGYELTV